MVEDQSRLLLEIVKNTSFLDQKVMRLSQTSTWVTRISNWMITDSLFLASYKQIYMICILFMSVKQLFVKMRSHQSILNNPFILSFFCLPENFNSSHFNFSHFSLFSLFPLCMYTEKAFRQRSREAFKINGWGKNGISKIEGTTEGWAKH